MNEVLLQYFSLVLKMGSPLLECLFVWFGFWGD